MKFYIKDFFIKMWLNPQETADLVTFTEEIHYGKTSFFVQCKALLVSIILLLTP